MPRQTLYALLAAAFAAGTLAAPAEAATRHHTQHHASHMHATSAMHGRTAQDNSADALNAQSLARTQSGSGAAPAAPAAPKAPMAPGPNTPQ